jgi:AraC-like DNA-binding protein
LVENLDLHDEGGSASLDIGPEFTTLNFALHLPGVSATEQICDLSAVVMYKIMQALCGADWLASTVKLIRREPDDRGPYRRYFRTTLFFNSTECAITFKNQCLKQPSPSADKLLYKYLKQEARQLHNLQHHELIEELPSVLTRGLLTENFAASHIADVFGIRERTLHRRLRVAGTSFRQELDRARKSVSEQLLGSTSLPVCDIANSLGYADSSGFIRAFQRWSGTSPSSWRKQNSL